MSSLKFFSLFGAHIGLPGSVGTGTYIAASSVVDSDSLNPDPNPAFRVPSTVPVFISRILLWVCAWPLKTTVTRPLSLLPSKYPSPPSSFTFLGEIHLSYKKPRVVFFLLLIFFFTLKTAWHNLKDVCRNGSSDNGRRFPNRNFPVFRLIIWFFLYNLNWPTVSTSPASYCS